MKRSLAAVFLGLATLASSPALAQDTPAETTPIEELVRKEVSPETLALALKLVNLTGRSRAFDELLPEIAEQAKNAFIRANPQMQLGIIELVDRAALTLVPRRPELDRYLARVWAAGFTEGELGELTEFFSTDTGRKFAEMQAKLLTVEMAAAREWAREVSEELRDKVAEELRLALSAEQQSITGEAALPAGAEAPAPATAEPEAAPAQ